MVASLTCYNFTKPWRGKHRSHSHYSVRVTAVFGRYYAFFSRWDAVLQIRQRPVDAVFAAVQIGFYAHCWSCFSGLDIGRSEPVFFIFNQQNELCANEHKVSVPTYFHFTSCRNCSPHVRQDGMACTVYRAATGPAHYSLQGCHHMLVKIASHSGKAGDDITSDCLTCYNNCFNRLHLQRAQVLSVLLLA